MIAPAPRFAAIPRAGLFTPEHDELRAVVRQYVERGLRPHAEEWERAGTFPLRRVFAEAGSVGLFGAGVGPEYGGTGPDVAADAVVTEEVAACGSGGVAASLGAHKDLGLRALHRLGTEEQRRRWLVPAVAGEAITALAVTEPDGGSDVAGMRTTATPEGDGWRLRGTKTFVTNGPVADLVVVAAKTDPGAGAGGISLFVVEAGARGFVARRVETVGWRTSHTGEIVLDGCRVPGEAVLGGVNEGFRHLVDGFVWERIVMALAAVAGAAKTLEAAIAYARDRRAFGRPVASFQTWRHRFANLATEIEAARSLTYHAVRRHAAGEDAGTEAAMAKWYATELGWRVADEAVQVHGGYGYMMEYGAQRAWRDARAGPIGGGTTEIMKEIVGRALGV